MNLIDIVGLKSFSVRVISRSYHEPTHIAFAERFVNLIPLHLGEPAKEGGVKHKDMGQTSHKESDLVDGCSLH